MADFVKVDGDGEGVVPLGYRLASEEDVRRNVSAVGQVLPDWEIARLAGGAAVSGRRYGVSTTMDHRSNGLGHSLCIANEFLKVDGDGVVPRGYRLATAEDVRRNVGAVGQVLPGWEIARLAGGAAVSGRLYGVLTTMDHRSSGLGHSLCIESAASEQFTRPGGLAAQFARRIASSLTAPSSPPTSPPPRRSPSVPPAPTHSPPAAALTAPPAAAPPAVAPPPHPTSTAQEDPTTCVICLSSPREVGFLHGETVHACACRDCARHLPASSPCPVCRQRIERVLAVY